MQSIILGGFFSGKMWKNMGKRPFTQVAMAGLGQNCTGGCGRIGVYRVKCQVEFVINADYIELFLDQLDLHPIVCEFNNFFPLPHNPCPLR